MELRVHDALDDPRDLLTDSIYVFNIPGLALPTPDVIATGGLAPIPLPFPTCSAMPKASFIAFILATSFVALASLASSLPLERLERELYMSAPPDPAHPIAAIINTAPNGRVAIPSRPSIAAPPALAGTLAPRAKEALLRIPARPAIETFSASAEAAKAANKPPILSIVMPYSSMNPI